MTWASVQEHLGDNVRRADRAALHAKTGAFVMRTSASDGPADSSATRRKDRSAVKEPRQRALAQASLTSIFFAAFSASAVFGRVTVRTPFFKLASILSVSMPSGSRKQRWNDPNSRSLR
jgi:hypothetical protein